MIKRKKVKRKPKSLDLRAQRLKLWEEYQALPLPKETAHPYQAWGNLEADNLLIAPPITNYDKGITPFTDPAARYTHSVFSKHSVDVRNSFFVIPCHRYGDKPNKASTLDLLPLIQKWTKLGKTKNVFCVGKEAYRFTFCGGLTTSLKTLAGRQVYLSVKLGSVPLVVIPDIYGTVQDIHDKLPFREQKWREELQGLCREEVTKSISKTIKFL